MNTENANQKDQRPPHHGAAGNVCTFNVRLHVDTKALAHVIGEDEADVKEMWSSAHTLEHAMVGAFVKRVFEGSVVVKDAAPESLINGGNRGFHIVTLVTDGYGNVIAEDQRGREQAKAKVTELPEDEDATEATEDAIRLVLNKFLAK